MKAYFSFRLTLLISLSLAAFPALLTAQNYALIFAVEQYQDNQRGEPGAIHDAIALGAVLSTRFDFQVEVVENPAKAEIHNKLEQYRRRFAWEDYVQDGQLLVYFLGRGAEENRMGYFLTADADARRLNTSALNWHGLLREISNTNCRHILVAADAEQAGVLRPIWDGGEQPAPRHFLERGRNEGYLQERRSFPTRIMLVLDTGKKSGSQNSSLTRLFREGLNEMADIYAPISMGRIQEYITRWAGEAAVAYSFAGDDIRSNFVFSRPNIQMLSLDQLREDEAQRWQLERQNMLEVNNIYSSVYSGSGRTSGASFSEDAFSNTPAAEGRDWQKARAAFREADGFVRVNGGIFTPGAAKRQDGSGNTAPEVIIGGFFLSPREVSIAEFEAFCLQTRRKTPQRTGWEGGASPVVHVDWYDALEYCNWLSRENGLEEVYEIEKTPMDPENYNLADTKKWIVTANWKADGYRLPTVAEWEHAACTFGGISAAGSIGKMGYTVQEWCWDWETFGYHKWYDNLSNPRGPRKGAFRSIRGKGGESSAYSQPCALPKAGAPTLVRGDLGFRVVRNARPNVVPK